MQLSFAGIDRTLGVELGTRSVQESFKHILSYTVFVYISVVCLRQLH